MDITAASTERTIHIRICHHLWIRAFNMYIFKIPGFYECPISWVHFISQCKNMEGWNFNVFQAGRKRFVIAAAASCDCSRRVV